MQSPTVILDMPEAEYHARPEVSAHQLMKILECPAKFRDAIDHPPEPTPAMIFGSRFHAALLEPLRYGEQYIQAAVKPDCDLRLKINREMADRYNAECAVVEASGKDQISANDYTAIAGMKASCMAHPDIARAVSDSKHEVSIFWVDSETGVEMRARIDMVRFKRDEGRGTLDDVKTTTDASANAVRKDVGNFNYDMQAAVYIDGFASVMRIEPEDVTFSLDCVEKSSPYLCARYTLPALTIALGRAKYRAALNLFTKCKETNDWPSYYSGMLPEPTAWELKEWGM